MNGHITDSHICRTNPGATSAFERAGEKTDKNHDHKSSPAHQSSNATTVFPKNEEDAPMITVLVAIATVDKQMVAIPLDKKGNRDPLASRCLAALARYVGHSKVIIQRRL